MSIAVVLEDGQSSYPVETGTPEWVDSLEWARFHGLDPNQILGGSVVTRDARNCRITYDALVFDDAGVVVVDDGLEAVTVRCVEQGEAPPLPFPASVVSR